MSATSTAPTAAKRKTKKLAPIEPIAVGRIEARRALGGVGDDKLYRLIHEGEIESYLDGNARKYVYASIKAYVARKLAGDNGLKKATWVRPRHQAE